VESKTLSQREIDALLSTLGADEPAVEADDKHAKLKKYDFRSPARFSRDQMRTLRMIFEEFARQTSSVLAILLRTKVRARFVYLEQTAGDGISNLLGDNPAVVVNLIRLAPLPGRALLILAGDLVWSLVERVLGARSTTLQTKEREITDIELSLMEAVMRHILRGLQSAWAKVIEVSPVLDSSSVDLELVQTAPVDEVILSAMLEIYIDEVTGSMAFLMPISMLNPISSLLRPHLLAMQHEDEEEEEEATERDAAAFPTFLRLQRAPLPITVLLGEAELDFKDLIQLQAGDVIRLNRAIDEELEVHVAGQSRFMSQPGLKGSSLAVRITRLVPDMQ